MAPDVLDTPLAAWPVTALPETIACESLLTSTVPFHSHTWPVASTTLVPSTAAEPLLSTSAVPFHV